jgi:hypothetical protein
MSCGTMVGGGIVTWIMSPVTMMKSSGIGILPRPDSEKVERVRLDHIVDTDRRVGHDAARLGSGL